MGSRSYSLGIIIVRLIAEGEAKAGDFDMILPEHLWNGLCKISDLPDEVITGLVDIRREEKSAIISEVRALQEWFAAKQIDATRVRRRVRSLLGKGKGTRECLHRSPESVAFFETAAQLAEANRENIVNVLHLTHAILENPPPILSGLLIQCGQGKSSLPSLAKEEEKSQVSQDQAQVQKPGILSYLGRDLTALAARGELDAVIGRRDEMRRLAQILIQKRKGNAILVGDAGVGKTCIVEGLAQRIASPKCSPALRGKRIIELSMATLLAGAVFRGQFEARLEAVIYEAEADPNIILFIDEFHTIMTPGGGGLDAANILKPALTHGKLRLIGSTTTQEYERYLVKDNAIARRFEVIWIEEPSREEAIEIVAGAKSGLEAHHDLTITREAIETAVDLSLRYVPDRRLPDKALDLVDQACAQQALQSISIKIEGQDVDISAAREEALSVGHEEIARVVSKRCRIPYELLTITLRERLKMFEPYLTQRVIGQEKAIQDVTKALRAAYSGLKDPRRPIASFLFAGPTGVGKTETAKMLAEFLFGTSESLIKIDLSEYTERHQIARLLGAPPGYVGYEDPGMLTSALRQRPASVVLFDEVEKAHPDVLNVLLQVLDEGQLTDGQGRKVSFRETVVVLTSNILFDNKLNQPLGFKRDAGPETKHAEDRERLLSALQRYLRPELIGRIQHIIVFESLNHEVCIAIAEKVLSEVEKRLQKEVGGMSALPKELREHIMEKIGSFRFGAREIEQLVESEVAAWLSDGKDYA